MLLDKARLATSPEANVLAGELTTHHPMEYDVLNAVRTALKGTQFAQSANKNSAFCKAVGGKPVQGLG